MRNQKILDDPCRERPSVVVLLEIPVVLKEWQYNVLKKVLVDLVDEVATDDDKSSPLVSQVPPQPMTPPPPYLCTTRMQPGPNSYPL